jgi:hypothetical protein
LIQRAKASLNVSYGPSRHPNASVLVSLRAVAALDLQIFPRYRALLRP